MRRAGRLTWRFGLLALAAVLATSLPLPWGLAGLVFTLAALVVGVMALVATVVAGLRAPPIVVLSVGLALVGVLLLLQVVQVVFWPVTVAAQQCREAAITSQAQEACEAQQRDRTIDQLLGR